MIGYIYKTTCIINGKIYVGKHESNIWDSTYYGSGSKLTIAITEFGKENFICELIDTAETIEELIDKERYWISCLKSRDPDIGYNVYSGGFGTRKIVRVLKDDAIRYVNKKDLDNYIQDGWIKIDSKTAQRIWRKQNPEYYKTSEAVKKYQKQYREKNKEKRNQQVRDWYKKNSAYAKTYRQINKTKLYEKQKDWLAKNPNYKKEWYQKHIEEEHQRSKEYYKQNKEKQKASHDNYVKKNKDKIKEYQRENRLKHKKSKK